MRTRLLILLVWLASSPAALAQADGEGVSKRQKLNTVFRGVLAQMQGFYDQGDLDSVVYLYEQKCLLMATGPRGERRETPLFRKVKNEIQADIYSVAARAYLALDRPREADPSIRRLFALRFDEPFDSYWLSVRNAREYVYYTSPRLQMGLRGGGNLTTAAPFNRFSIFDAGQGSTDKAYLPASEFLRDGRFLGQQAGFGLEYAFTKNLSLNAQIGLLGMRYAYIDYYRWENRQAGALLALDLDNEHFTRLTLLDFPLVAKYRVVKYRLQPFVQFGAAYSSLTAAARIINTLEDPSVQVGNAAPTLLFGQELETNKDVRGSLVRGQFGLLAGAGVSYALGRFRLLANLGYRHGLNNLTRRANRFDDPELTFGFHDVPDDLRLHNWDFSFSLYLPVAYKAYKN